MTAAMPWLRLHNDIGENPKILMLAPSDRWYYVHLLSLKSQGILDEYTGDKLKRVVSTKLRIYGDEFTETMRRLQEEDLIDKKLQPIGWEKRQYKSDSSTERVRKHRAEKRKKQAGNGGETFHETPDETLHETLQDSCSNGSVTPPDTENREQIQNKNSSEPKGSAASAANPASNSRLTTLEKFYDSGEQGEESATSLIFGLGVKLLAKYSIPGKQARAVLGMYRRDHGEGALMDALCEAYCRKPAGDPVGYICSILKNPKAPMPKDWQPPQAILDGLVSSGIPEPVVQNARAFFKLWVLERDITSADFDGWFHEWCIRDYEDAQADWSRMGRWYGDAKSKEFVEPPSDTLPG